MITNHVVVGAGSVVIKNIEEPGIYAGSPAKGLANEKNGNYCRSRC